MYAVVDLEATNAVDGMSDRRIIQIGITFIENYHIHETLCFDVNPEVSISSKITELTGITDEQVKYAPIFEEIAEYIYTLLEGCIFVAHNVQFDYSLLKKEFERVGFTSFSMPNLDTVELSKIMFPTEASYSLKNLSKSKQIFHSVHHNAGSDSLATAELFLLLLNEIDKLDISVSQNINYLLSAKSDAHASLFQMSSVINPIQQTINGNWQRKECQVSAALSPDIASVIEKMDSGYHPVLPENQLAKVLPQLVREEKITLLLMPNTVNLDEWCKPFPYVNVVKKEQNYINLKQLEQLLLQTSYFTIQEVRQLCTVLVWLTFTETGDLTDLDLTDKLRYQLSLNGRKEADSIYQQHLQSIQNSVISVMYQQDFIQQLPLLKEKIEFNRLQLCINDMYAWSRVIEWASVAEIYNGNHFYWLLKNKQKWQQQNDAFSGTIASEKILKIDRILDEYKWFLNRFAQRYRDLFMLDEGEGTFSYYVDARENIDTFWFIRFKHALELFQTFVLETPLATELYAELEKQEEALTQLIVAHHNKQFFSVEKKNKKQTTYRILMHNVNYHSWLAEQVYQNVSSVCYFSRLTRRQDMLINYLQKYLNDSKLFVVDWDEQVTVPAVVYTIPIVASKENLFVKKLSKYLLPDDKKTLIIVPSKRMLKKLVDSNEHLNDFNHLHIKTQQAVITWKEWQKQPIVVNQFDKVIIAKFPFDSPDSLEASIGKNYLLSASYETYFDDWALPKMLLVLFDCLYTCIQHHVEVHVMDYRIEESVYKHKIKTNLEDTCIFERLI